MTATINNILVPVDFSSNAERALDYATMLAKRHGAAIELLHVVDDPFTSGAWTPDSYVPNLTELLQVLIAQARERLRPQEASLRAQGIRTESWVMSGVPSREIVARAADAGFDLIVMGTHGRTGLAHVVMGSVAERVVRRAPCPVLTVREAVAPEGVEDAVPLRAAVA
jgi:universal stress protein A